MKQPIEFVALESASLSKEGIFDFLFGKKDEPASYKKLERLEAELAQVKAKEILDVVAGRTKPSQEVIDRIVGFAEKHIAPAMVYRQNTQLFDILAKLVHLPDPQPYRVSEELDEAQTAKDAERIAKDFIRVMGPQLKLMRGAKQVVIGTATPEQLLADVTSNYQENMKHIKNCSYSTPTPHETYLATCLAQDFGYPSGTWSNSSSPGLEELRDKNESLFDEIAEALENIADVADEFEMCWKLKKESKYRHYNPINDDLSFLVRARCALLDYALKLKVNKEDLERADLLEGIKIATEAVSDLSVLSAAMNSGANDAHFGKYNFPLYSNQVKAICRKLQVAPVELSTESISVSASKVSNLQSVVEATLAELQKKVS